MFLVFVDGRVVQDVFEGKADESAALPDHPITISVAGETVVARAQTLPTAVTMLRDAFPRFAKPLIVQSVRVTVTAFRFDTGENHRASAGSECVGRRADDLLPKTYE